MAKLSSLSICLFTILTVMFLAIGSVLLVLGIPHVLNVHQTTCTVIQQKNIYYSCTVSCSGCNPLYGGSGEPCVCLYTDYTDYVTWQYTAYNNTYTIQSQVCSDGQNTYDPNYAVPCWYNNNNPNSASFIGPTIGWILVGIGSVALCAAVATVIGPLIWYYKNKNTYAEL